MTPTQLEHIKRIDAHLTALLELAAKRTPGEWTINKDRNWENYSVEADDTVCDFFYMSEETHHRHPFQEGSEENNAAFIASCAGNAEAGWCGAKAAISIILEAEENPSSFGSYTPRLLAENILAAWPIELITKH